MLERVQTVIAAFEVTPNEYELFSLSRDVFKQHMRDSKGEDKVGLVRKKIFLEQGAVVARGNINAVNTWIFQATPDRFDVQGYVAKYKTIYWSVGHTHFDSTIKVGDEVFVWKALGKAKDFSGVVAHGFVVEPPVEKAKVQFPENLGDEFWKGDGKEKSTLKVGVKLDEVRITPETGALLKEKFFADEQLKNLQLIKARVGTVFLIKSERVDRLRSLWASPNPLPAQARLENEGEFNVSNVEEAKEKVLRSIALRRGQRKFRNALLDAYANACAVTGTAIKDVLEAAHIVAYQGTSTNHVCNGLLLRSDIHALFDLGLLSIDPKTLCVYCSEQIRQETMYKELHGKKLRMPTKANQQPDYTALQGHFEKRVN
jgi:hypothetical protein